MHDSYCRSAEHTFKPWGCTMVAVRLIDSIVRCKGPAQNTNTNTKQAKACSRALSPLLVPFSWPGIQENYIKNSGRACLQALGLHDGGSAPDRLNRALQGSGPEHKGGKEGEDEASAVQPAERWEGVQDGLQATHSSA